MEDLIWFFGFKFVCIDDGVPFFYLQTACFFFLFLLFYRGFAFFEVAFSVARAIF